MIDNPKFNIKETLTKDWVIEADKLKVTCWLNEAQCELKLEHWTNAITCCEKVLDVESTNVKVQLSRLPPLSCDSLCASTPPSNVSHLLS